MAPDNTRSHGPRVTGDDIDDGYTAHVVLVADGDPDVTDEAARVLRDDYTVRTAGDDEKAFASLDGDVSVAVVDPAAFDRTPGELVASIRSYGIHSVAAFREDAVADGDDPFDDTVVKPVAPAALKRTVDRLCRGVAYRSALDRYYDLAEARATLPADDPQRDRLDRRMERLRDRLDDVAAALDSAEIYEAVLRDDGDQRSRSPSSDS